MKSNGAGDAGDPTLEIFRAQAEERLDAAFEGMKPIYAKAVRDHILATCKTGADFAKLTERRIVSLGREWFEENEVDAEEALIGAPKRAASARPPASRAARGSSSAGATSDRQRNEAAPPKSRDEWESRHRQKVQEFSRHLQG